MHELQADPHREIGVGRDTVRSRTLNRIQCGSLRNIEAVMISSLGWGRAVFSSLILWSTVVCFSDRASLCRANAIEMGDLVAVSTPAEFQDALSPQNWTSHVLVRAHLNMVRSPRPPESSEDYTLDNGVVRISPFTKSIVVRPLISCGTSVVRPLRHPVLVHKQARPRRSNSGTLLRRLSCCSTYIAIGAQASSACAICEVYHFRCDSQRSLIEVSTLRPC